MGKQTRRAEKKNRKTAADTQLMDELFDAAFEYKELKLWKKLWDDQVFAVRCQDGTVLYACVMGRNGEYTAIAFYRGAAGLDTLRRLRNNEMLPREEERLEAMLCQDCVSCSFDAMDDLRLTEQAQLRDYCKRKGRKLRGPKACPHLERFVPNHLPWNIRKDLDKQHLLEGLRAACAVAKALQEQKATAESLGIIGNPDLTGSCPLLVAEEEGWSWQQTELPDGPKIIYESPTLTELEVKRLKKRKPRGTWAMGMFLLPQPVIGEGEDTYEPGDKEPYDAPCFPFMICAVDIASGQSIFHVLYHEEVSFQEMLQNAVTAMEKYGCPAIIQVQDERMEAFCEAWTRQVGIKLQFEEEIPALEDFIAELFAFSHKDEREAAAEIFQEIIEAMDDPKYLMDITDDDLMMLCMLSTQAPMPEQLKSRILKEANRRELI